MMLNTHTNNAGQVYIEYEVSDGSCCDLSRHDVTHELETMRLCGERLRFVHVSGSVDLLSGREESPPPPVAQ